jgi:hypothetical protein
MPSASLRAATALLVSLTAFLPCPATAQQAQEFGAASFVAPAGWSLDSHPRMQVFSWVRGRDRCMLVMSAEEQSPPGLEAAFAAAWRTLFTGAYRKAEQPASVERTSPTGSRYAVGEGHLEDAAGNRLVARLHVFPLGSTSQWIALIGNRAPALTACGNDWETFFTTLRFRLTATESTPSSSPPGAAQPVDHAVPGNTEGVAADSPRQFENLSFVPPRGWTVRRMNGLVQLSAAGTRGAEKLDVLLLPGRVSSASLEQELEATWGEIRSLLNAELLRNVSGRTYDLDEPGRSLAGVEYLKGNGGMRTGSAEWDVSVYVLRAEDRVERVAVLARAFTENLSKVTTANNPRFSSEIRQLVFRLKFANQPERSLPPAGLRPGGIVGVWAGLGMSFGRIKTEFAVFFDNGLAYFGPGMPTEGLHEIDPVVEQPVHRRDWGTYTWAGGAGVLTMPYGTIPLRSSGPVLELTTNQTPHRYIKLVLPLSSRLDGTWCYGDGKCLRFTPEGRFEDSGAVRVAEHSLYAWPEAPPGGAGKYLVRDHTLYLVYDGGPELRIAFPGIEDGRTSSPNDLRLGWNADLLTRR